MAFALFPPISLLVQRHLCMSLSLLLGKNGQNRKVKLKKAKQQTSTFSLLLTCLLWGCWDHTAKGETKTTSSLGCLIVCLFVQPLFEKKKEKKKEGKKNWIGLSLFFLGRVVERMGQVESALEQRKQPDGELALVSPVQYFGSIDDIQVTRQSSFVNATSPSGSRPASLMASPSPTRRGKKGRKRSSSSASTTSGASAADQPEQSGPGGRLVLLDKNGMGLKPERVLTDKIKRRKRTAINVSHRESLRLFLCLVRWLKVGVERKNC